MNKITEPLINAILEITIFSEASPPDPSVCVKLADQLSALARKGDATAASLYTLIAAVGKCGEVFDADLACDLLFKCKDAFEAYESIAIDALYTIVDDDVYYKIESFPITHSLKKIREDIGD
jgi:hypothetical protein